MKKSKFNLSHQVLLTADFGTLIPILCQECLPGDVFKISTEMFTRFQALIAPCMQRVDAKIEYFFVPNRIMIDGWKDYITDNATGDMLPRISAHGQEKNSLLDYLGLPVRYQQRLDDGTYQTVYPEWDNLNGLPVVAYHRIWYDWYADQNMQSTEIAQFTDRNGDFNTYLSGNLADQYYRLHHRCYPRDYFTSALPFAQAGDAARIPLTYPNGTTTFTNVGTQSGDLTVDNYVVKVGSSNARLKLNNADNIVQGPTIEETRRANAIQRWLEKNARFGRRYIEQIAAHFGVRVPDYRLDRAEYLGSNRSPITISEVLQKSQTTNDSVLGDMAGHAVGGGVASMRKYHVQEHGYIMGILSFVPRASYGEGIPRMFIKNSLFDFAFPEFDRLGEQPIYDCEIDGLSDNTQVFGYVPRYWEYKRSFDRFCGDFRDTLGHWHLGRMFDDTVQPALNEDFVTINGGQSGVLTDRIFAVEGTPHILVQLYHHVKAIRPLSNKPPKL